MAFDSWREGRDKVRVGEVNSNKVKFEKEIEEIENKEAGLIFSTRSKLSKIAIFSLRESSFITSNKTSN